MQKHKRALFAFAIFVLILAALACTCGPLTQAQEALSTGQAAATQVGDALGTGQAVATLAGESLPTVQAAQTQFGGALDEAAPTLTAVALTLQASGIDLTALPGGITGGSTGGQDASGACTGNDGFETEFVRTIALGATETATLDNLFAAHNWEFEGTAGQNVTISVTPVGDTDPRIKLLDESCTLLGEDDDGGPDQYGSLLTFTLPANGTYTVRVDVYSGGDYQINIQ